jgi:hypothetical protein
MTNDANGIKTSGSNIYHSIIRLFLVTVMDKMYLKLQELMNSGYLLWSVSGSYCMTIKEIDGRDRYVLLELVGENWIIITQ